MTDKNQSPNMAASQTLTVRIPSIGFHESWSDHSSVKQYLSSLINKWSWLIEAHHSTKDHYINLFVPSINKALLSLDAFEARNQNQNDASYHAFKENLQQNLARIIEEHHPLTSDNFYNFCNLLKEDDRKADRKDSWFTGLVVATALGKKVNPQEHITTLDIANAVFEWRLYCSGLSTRKDVNHAELSSAMIKYQGYLKDGEAKILLTSKNIEELQIEFTKELKTLKDDYERYKSTSQSSIDATLNSTISELETFRQKYLEGASLKAPAVYWRNKASYHKDMAFKFQLSTFISIGALILALIVTGIFIDDKFIANFNKNWHFYTAITLSTVTLVGVVLRLLIRMYLSHVHLHHDAEERVTMARTYVALAGLPSKEGDNTFGVVYGALFRQATDGVVKEDILPPAILDAIGKIRNS